MNGNSGSMQAPRSEARNAPVEFAALGRSIRSICQRTAHASPIKTVNIPQTAEQLAYTVDPGPNGIPLYFADIGVNL